MVRSLASSGPGWTAEAPCDAAREIQFPPGSGSSGIVPSFAERALGSPGWCTGFCVWARSLMYRPEDSLGLLGEVSSSLCSLRPFHVCLRSSSGFLARLEQSFCVPALRLDSSGPLGDKIDCVNSVETRPGPEKYFLRPRERRKYEFRIFHHARLRELGRDQAGAVPGVWHSIFYCRHWLPSKGSAARQPPAHFPLPVSARPPLPRACSLQ